MKTASGSDFAFSAVKVPCVSINPHRAAVTLQDIFLNITEPVLMPFKRYFLEMEKLIPVSYMGAGKSKERY